MKNLTAHLDVLHRAIERARSSRDWIVVVAPSSEDKMTTLSRIMVGMLPAEATLCGRTALFPGGGRLTMAAAQHSVHGKDFHVMFLGFDDKSLPADEIAQHGWRVAAKSVVTFGEMRAS